MRKRLLPGLAGLLTLFWSVASFAGNFNPKPASDDMILSILAKTIGPSIHQISGVGTGTVSAITTALQDINELVLILGGLLLTYIIGASIMKTAHEGEPLGQKWSSMWIPLKAAIGAALILPVPSLGGLSAAQGIVIWLLTFGIGAGDALWTQTISYIAQNPVGSVVVSPIHTGQLAEGIIDSQVCEQGINATANHYWPGLTPISRTGPTAENTLNPLDAGIHVLEGYQETVSPLPGEAIYATKYSEYDWTASGGPLGDLTSMGFLPSACGKVAYVSGAEGTGMGARMINTIGSDNGTAIGTLITSLKPISANLYEEKKPGTDDTNFVKAINAYDTTMQTDIQNAASAAIQPEVQKYVSAAKIDGFATAGEWFWDLVQWNHIAQHAANSLGDATGMDFGSALGKLGSSHINGAESRAASFIKENGSLVGHIQPSSNINADIGGLFANASPLIIDAMSDGASNPLIAVRNIGAGMEDAGGALLTVSVAMTAGAGAANGGIDKDVPIVGNATNAVTKVILYDVNPIMLTLSGILFVEGFFLSFVVPLIPFMVWIAGLLGFLLMAFEMIVAAPLWAIAHMHPDGHEMVGMGSQGYKLAFAIITRPFLMILGLIGGYALFMGYSALVTPMITKAVASSQSTGGGIAGPLDMIGAVGMYVTLTVIIAYECFKLVFLLPEKVMAWASAQHSGYNEGSTVDRQKQSHDGAKKSGESLTGNSHQQGFATGMKRKNGG